MCLQSSLAFSYLNTVNVFFFVQYIYRFCVASKESPCSLQKRWEKSSSRSGFFFENAHHSRFLQRKMVLVVNLFVFLRLDCFFFAVVIFDLVQDMRAIFHFP